MCKVRIIYDSGKTQIFVVPGDLAVIDFIQLAKSIGGKIKKVEWL